MAHFLLLFSYRSFTGDFYVESGGSAVGSSLDLWKYANMILGFGNIALFSTAALTQVLAMASIAVEINGIVWNYGFRLGVFLQFTFFFLDMLAKDQIGSLIFDSS